MSRVVIAAVAALAWSSAAESAATVPALNARIEAYVSQPQFASALWGVKVVSLETGTVLFAHHADRLMSPASNSKLYTAALALDHFGSDYRIETPILASTAPNEQGELKGDLIVSGRGDPTWKSHPRRADFWATFEPFIAVLKQARVRQIAGDVVADATYFRMPRYGAGWVIDDLNDDYGAEISAVTLDENFVDLRVRPSAVVGRACELELLHPMTGLVFHNRTLTTVAAGPRTLHVRRDLGGNRVFVFGELPVNGAEQIVDVTVPQPATWFAAALKEALQRAGIRVDGNSRSVQWPDHSPVTTRSFALGRVASPPLREVVAAFMKPSQNLETDLIFAHVGEAFRAAGAPAWQTSEQAALSALRNFLRRHALPADDVRFDEGSGLSRNNLTTANATVALLECMSRHAEAKAFFDALPIAGVDGTIRRRMKATAAEGNVHAKTGTLRWANALSGYVTSAAGERLAFSIMLNRAVAPSGGSGRNDVDAIAVMLAEFNGRSGVERAALRTD